MEHRPQRQGYSDLTEREEEGVPALESDEPPQYPDLGPSGEAEDYTSSTSGEEADATRREGDEEAGADRSDEGANSGGQRSGGDGGLSSTTGG